MTNPDFSELFSALSAEGADFLVVGAHAVMIYTEPRYTKDLDLWVRPTRQNAARVLAALRRFGAPLADLTVDDLATPGTIFQMGMAPNRIDLLTSLDGLDFDSAWTRRVPSSYGGSRIHVLSRQDLITNKRTVGRPRDLLDVESLEKAIDPPEPKPDS